MSQNQFRSAASSNIPDDVVRRFARAYGMTEDQVRADLAGDGTGFEKEQSAARSAEREFDRQSEAVRAEAAKEWNGSASRVVALRGTQPAADLAKEDLQEVDDRVRERAFIARLQERYPALGADDVRRAYSTGAIEAIKANARQFQPAAVSKQTPTERLDQAAFQLGSKSQELRLKGLVPATEEQLTERVDRERGTVHERSSLIAENIEGIHPNHRLKYSTAYERGANAALDSWRNKNTTRLELADEFAEYQKEIEAKSGNSAESFIAKSVERQLRHGKTAIDYSATYATGSQAAAAGRHEKALANLGELTDALKENGYRVSAGTAKAGHALRTEAVWQSAQRISA